MFNNMSNQIKVELQESLGSDKSIASAAWTSSTTLEKQEQRTQEDVDRVVKMLITNSHASPIESVVFRFWIKMPIQTDRQFITHRIASHSSHNGMSGRYRTMPSEWLDIPEDVTQITVKGIGSVYTNDGPPYNYLERYKVLCAETNQWYKDILNQLKNSEKLGFITNQEYKRAREFFRGVLPQNNMTERVTVMNLRSFANFYKLRSSEHAQPEIRQIAELMLQAIKDSNICPVAIKALEENNWNI